MPSLFQILKTSKLGPQAAPDMLTALVAKKRAGDGKIRTLTGIPPLSFRANGKPLISWSMKGNGQQQGTPTPDAPIMPEFVGVRTGNLFDSAVYELVPVSASAQRKGTNLGVLPQGTYTFNAVSATSATPIYRTIKSGSTYTFEAITSLPYTFTADGVSEQIIRTSGTQGNTWEDAGYSSIILNAGTEPLPYEPYGWAEKITCAGQTVPVYLGQTQTVRRVKKLVLTGDENYALQSVNAHGIANFYFYIYNILSQYAICTHLKRQSTIISQTTDEGYLIAVLGQKASFYIRINSATASTVAELKAYLAAQYAAGTPVTVWYVLAEPETGIVNEPLCKIGDYVDELSSTDAGVTIPTAKGQNTLTVDTDLQPSEMTITGHIKQMQFVYVTDSDGVYCFDADGVQIIEEV